MGMPPVGEGGVAVADCGSWHCKLQIGDLQLSIVNRLCGEPLPQRLGPLSVGGAIAHTGGPRFLVYQSLRHSQRLAAPLAGILVLLLLLSGRELPLRQRHDFCNRETRRCPARIVGGGVADLGLEPGAE